MVRLNSFGMLGLRLVGLLVVAGLSGCGAEQSAPESDPELLAEMRSIQSGADIHVAVKSIDDIVDKVEKSLARWERETKKTWPTEHWNPTLLGGSPEVQARQRLANDAAAAGLLGERVRQLGIAAEVADRFRLRSGSYVYTELSNLKVDRGDTDDGIADARKGLEIATRQRLPSEIGLSGNLVEIYASIGDFESATAFMRRMVVARDRYTLQYPGVANNYNALTFATEARLLWSSGDLLRAENVARRCVAAAEADNKARAKVNTATASRSSRTFALVKCQWILAQTLMSQGRLADAESIARKTFELVHAQIGYRGRAGSTMLNILAQILAEQGRVKDAKRLVQLVIRIEGLIGADEESLLKTAARTALGELLVAERKWDEAHKEFQSLDEVLPANSTSRHRFLNNSLSRVLTTIKAGDAGAALSLARATADRIATDFGRNHPQAVEARGLIGLALIRTGDKAGAAAILEPIAEKMAGEVTSYESTGLTGARPGRQRAIVEGYLALVTSRGRPEDADRVFTIVEAMRGRSIGRAIGASSLPKAARTPEAAALVEQYLDKQAHIGSLQQAMLNAVSTKTDTPELRSRNQASIVAAQTEASTIKQQIRTRFPELQALMDPQPATLAALRASLRPTEAFVSTYTAEDQTYVWAISARGATMAVAPLGTDAMVKVIAKLRGAFEPSGSDLTDIPAFDVVAANELYKQLLVPVEAGWQGSATLIVAPHAALAQLPLSVLTTAPTALGKSQTLFAEYKTVPWLGRKVGIAQVPSGSAFLIQRALPPGDAGRKAFIGFGNPIFSKDSSDDQGVAVLSPLPDTEPELKEIAASLGADVAKDLFLGTAANDENVKKADISKRKVVMFATHGLVPGEIDGLTQPAIALSPAATGGTGEGLLTMADILTLKFDADWIVLSACNTASGQGEGAEALSGLGRAFFYAGARSMLVTNWSVESVSARLMTTGLFKRYAGNAGMSRAEVLKQSMLDLMDGPGAVENGKTVFSYAHPIFWAPFSLVGDPG